MNFNLHVVAQMGKNFDGTIMLDDTVIGAFGVDNEGAYLNLTKPLTLNETSNLIVYLNWRHADYIKDSELVIQYPTEEALYP